MKRPTGALRDHRYVADDRGSVSLFTLGIVLAALFLVALIVDGGRIRAQRRLAGDIAQQAARIGAQEVDEASRLSGGLVLDPDAATSAAQSAVAAAGGIGDAAVSDDSVTVEVVMTVDLVFLDALGARTVRASRVVEATEDF